MRSNLYGEMPKVVATGIKLKSEMMFAQYYPIKFPGSNELTYDKRFRPYTFLFRLAGANFIKSYGFERYYHSYIYVTVKNMYQHKDCPSFNREGYHSDGFLTNDINYIWSDSTPTIFNKTHFLLSDDDKLSIEEMEFQAMPENEVVFENNALLRLDQYCIHKTGLIKESGMRNFCKISISNDIYDLQGNAKNHLLDYDWTMRERSKERNIPQLL